MLRNALLAASLAVNVALYYYQNQNAPPPPPSPACHYQFQALDKKKMDLNSQKEQQALADLALDQAEMFSGERGEGHFGWLNLLKAFDYDPQNLDIAENLAANYQNLPGYKPIGYSELLEHNLTHLITDGAEQLKRDFAAAKKLWENLDPGAGCTTLAFATAVSTWELDFPVEMHESIYKTAVDMYKKLKLERPELTPTELNHELWNVQKTKLDRSGTYWGAFQDIDGFSKLVQTMRAASNRFLGQTYGVNNAEYKASHPLVVWVSVHTRDSKHEPHVTMDALVGGVYYVNVPRNAGRLELYDPRGKSPLTLHNPEQPSVPPFHRTIGIRPQRGKLVLFPGWLVHSVMKSTEPPTGEEEEYRVSLSLNLKGEWQTTAGLIVGCATF